jgi:hypothetical protein
MSSFIFKRKHTILPFFAVSFITVTLFLIYGSRVGFTREQTPTNTKVIVNEPTKLGADLDICKDYLQSKQTQEPKVLNIPIEEQNIQQNVGYQNNKFGLYIYRVDDFGVKAAEMVNSNGGDWGYVLVPYNVKDYDSAKWNSFFTILNQYHLIPIIQLWDVSKDPNDAKRDTQKAAEFLNSLHWPIEKRYVSAYNEVNDERFWKHGIDPKNYAELLDYTIDTFKGVDENFYMMNGAFNASARTGGGYLSADVYMQQMNNAVPGIFKKLDGWASHPYPHVAGYLGKPGQNGRDSIRAYEWELDILKNQFGVTGLPVFITETGWPHAEGKDYNESYYSEETAAQYLKEAFENVWLPDDRVVAVTPFTIKYDPPHDHFSFIKSDGSHYKVFDVIKDMPKQAGIPPVIESIDPLRDYCESINN